MTNTPTPGRSYHCYFIFLVCHYHRVVPERGDAKNVDYFSIKAQLQASPLVPRLFFQ
jgi:hypothetical protein